MIAEHRDYRHLYKGTVKGTDGSVAVILIKDGMLQPLRQCWQLYTDGTFEVSVSLSTYVCKSALVVLPNILLNR